MASFPGKIGWKRQRKKENKKLSFRFVPTRPVIENSKKIQKIKKYHYGFISRQNRLEKAEKERKQKIIVLFRSYLIRNQKLQTNSKKIQKIRRIPFWLYFKQK